MHAVMHQTHSSIQFSSPRSHSRSPAPPPILPPPSSIPDPSTDNVKDNDAKPDNGTPAVSTKELEISDFILPDLVADCKYKRRCNPHCDSTARESEQWLLGYANFEEDKKLKFMGLKAGELTAACYPYADKLPLRVCDDFMNYLFNLDDWLDNYDVPNTKSTREICLGAMQDPEGFDTTDKAGILTKSFFSRLASQAGPGCKSRFIHTMDLFFIAVAKQSKDRLENKTPDLEDYINVRRDTSGCKPCFQLIEFANGFDLPDEVVNHPVIQSLEQYTNDLVTWSNDIFSWNTEQSRHDTTHNMIPVIMRKENCTHQQAIDAVGERCRQTMKDFEYKRTNEVPDFGSKEVNAMVQLYIEGLENWICGSLHWSFETERYFGKNGQDVKANRFIEILPKRSLAPEDEQ